MRQLYEPPSLCCLEIEISACYVIRNFRLVVIISTARRYKTILSSLCASLLLIQIFLEASEDHPNLLRLP
jgi:hypothetical protein